jgi:Siphovirus Gp157
LATIARERHPALPLLISRGRLSFLTFQSKRRCNVAASLSIVPAACESVFDIARRLTALIDEAEQEAAGGQLPDRVRERLADTVEALRLRVARKPDRDPRSLFDLDERLIDLMDRAEEAAETGDIPQALLQEINDYLDAFRTKVDRIAGYWRWQEFIVEICGTEVDRLSARKKAAEGRVNRLKGMLLAFMMSRGLKKLEGEKSSIGMQPNSMTSLMIDDPLQIGECFFENHIRLTKTELQELVYQLADGELRRRLEAQLKGEGWEINGSAVRFAITNNSPVNGARLVKGHHVRLR